ncbi:MAG: peptidoglycan editing factor PgeF, partial [Candidatus Gastranaerophilales bacterium]|nr:peptidoglycan editing factor PgeF [Candidatus Gastranaerophilales bacterium]
MFKIKKIENKSVYYSDILPIEHFFTTRELEISENIELVSKYLSIEPKNLIKPQQVHGDNIELVDKRNEYPSCDGLILNEKNKAIYLNFADCTPIILYDNKNNIASIAHADWRGTALRIGAKTVLKMNKLFNTKPSDIIAVIGPCISFSEFETSKEAIKELSASVQNKKDLFRENYANLKEINKRQLEEIGVLKFDICPFCTVLDNDKFFSYRKENKTTKRHSALVKLD